MTEVRSYVCNICGDVCADKRMFTHALSKGMPSLFEDEKVHLCGPGCLYLHLVSTADRFAAQVYDRDPTTVPPDGTARPEPAPADDDVAPWWQLALICLAAILFVLGVYTVYHLTHGALAR